MTWQIEIPVKYRMCRTCGRRLNRERERVRLPSGAKFHFARWVHGGAGEEHEPIPILETEERPAVFVCDCCSSLKWEWRVQTESFDVPISNIHTYSESTWLMCDPCYRAYETKDPEVLVDHVIDALASERPDVLSFDPSTVTGLRERLLPMYRKLVNLSTGHAEHIDR